MSNRNAVLCSSCSLLFNIKERVEVGPSTAYIPVPQSHRLHRFISSTDASLALRLADECHFCSILVRMRFRSDKYRGGGPTCVPLSQKQHIFLKIYEWDNFGDHGTHSIEIQEGRGLGGYLFRNSRLELFKPDGMLSATVLDVLMPW